jgi:hypothetical protein
MLSVDDICTFAIGMIVNPTQVDLVFRTTSSHMVVMTCQLKQKKNSTTIDTLHTHFFPLVIKVFGCLHQ